MLRLMAIAQGVYYVGSGIWPVLHMKSFEAVTGPKHDDWLVKTVGSLITAVGASLLMAGMTGRVTREMIALAGLSAAVLGAVDVIYSTKRVISKVYLVDALPEFALATFWLLNSHRGDGHRI